jgi:hypothetical protein
MDISKELKEILNNNKTAIDISDNIEQQQKELHIKGHIFWAFSVRDAIKELMDNNFFNENGIKEIAIENSKHLYSQGNNLAISLHDFDNDKEIHIESNDAYSSLKKLLRKFQFRESNLNPLLCPSDDSGRYVEVNDNPHDGIFDLLLSKELKSIIEHSELNIDMQQNDIKISRIKI